MSHYPTLYLLLPDQLPRRRAELEQSMTPDMRQALAIHRRISPQHTDADVHAAVIAALQALLPDKSAAKCPEPHEVVAGDYTEHEIHDLYCRIVRTSGHSGRILLRSTLQSYQELLEEALIGGTTIDAPEWFKLRGAFDALVRYLALDPLPQPPDPALGLPAPRPQITENFDSLRRWVLGHHVFIGLIQGLVMAFYCFASAVERDDTHEAKVALRLATTLMEGSGVALRFTGDFRHQDYEEIVRPSMMPPQMPPGLSGLLSIDHHAMVKLLQRLKPLLLKVDEDVFRLYEAFLEAFHTTYEAHKHVCSRFNGDAQISLRMPPGSPRSAVEVLHQLKCARLQSIQVQRPNAN